MVFGVLMWRGIIAEGSALLTTLLPVALLLLGCSFLLAAFVKTETYLSLAFLVLEAVAYEL